MAKASQGIEYGTPTAKGRAQRAATGRLCAQAGCSTVLSTYNQATACWLHTMPSYTRKQERA